MLPGITGFYIRPAHAFLLQRLKKARLLFPVWLGLHCFSALAQAPVNCDMQYSAVLQHYHSQPDGRVVALLVTFLNQSAQQERRESMVNSSLLGFFSALNARDKTIKAAVASKLDSVTAQAHRQVLQRSLETSTAKLFAELPISPAYNDTAWGAFFATGEDQYLELLLRNCQHASSQDVALLLTGTSARWSLGANARQDSSVRAFLLARQATSAEARLILAAAPNVLQQAISEGVRHHSPKAEKK